jgi:Trk-type K+ transport system membrane component
MSSASGSASERNETRKERIDRELIELLNELRVALPGVQFLFAFLLIVPFQQTREQLTDFQLDVYFVALLASAVATGLLIAPAAQHRVLFRAHEKEKLLHRSHLSGLAGLVVLAVAICSALLLVVDVLFTRTQAWVTSGVVGLLLLFWWLAMPLWARAHSRQDPLPAAGDDDG